MFETGRKRNYTIEDLEQLLDSIPYEVYLKDADRRYRYANKASADRVGLNKKDLIGKFDYDFRSAEMAQICIDGDKKVLCRGKGTFIEDKLVKGDIETAYELFKAIIYCSETNEKLIAGIAKFVEIDKSVSKYIIKKSGEIMNTPQKLNTSIVNNEILTKLKDTTDASDVVLYLYDDDTKEMKLNEHLGKNKILFTKSYTIDDKIKDEYYDNSECTIYENLSNNSVKYIYLLKNSNKLLGCIHIYYKNKPKEIKEEFIRYNCLVLSFMQANEVLTDNLNKELKMRKEAQKKLQMMIDGFIDVYALLQIKDGNFIWLEISKRCNEILGWTVDDLNKKSYKDYIHSKDIENVELVLSIHSKKAHKISCTMLCKDGKWRTIDITVNHLADNIYMIVANDITLLTELQKKKEQLEHIVEVEGLKTEFFANLSHEFKTPLNMILSTVQVILNYMKINNKYPEYDNFNRYIRNIKQNSYRLLKLSNNMIDMTKIDGGFYEIDVANYNIVEIVENIVQSLVVYIKDKKRNIIFDTEEEEIITACDPNQIERIILNILSNAIKFTSDNGNIYVNIEVNGTCSKVIIKIKNDGENLNTDDYEKIFKRFTQIEHIMTRSREGSGIGLALVKSLVEMHNGIIYVIPQTEKGTEFCIELPIRKIRNSKCNRAWEKSIN